MNREFDDEEDDDEIFDDDEEAAANVAQVVSIPSTLNAVIKFGYEDTMDAALSGEDFDEWIAGVFTHTQAHFRHAASLGTTIEFEVCTILYYRIMLILTSLDFDIQYTPTWKCEFEEILYSRKFHYYLSIYKHSFHKYANCYEFNILFDFNE